MVGQSSDPVELVHVDLVGPMKVKGDGGALYSMTMVDDYTRLTWSFPLARKSDAARVIIEEWLPMVERESGKRVKAIRSDRGGGTFWVYLSGVVAGAVHLGLARGSKGWLMWDPISNTVFTTRDAKFMEGLMFKEWSEWGRSKVTIPLGIEVGTNNPLLIPIEFSSSSELTEVSHDLGGAEWEAADVEEVMQQGEAPVAERGDTEEEVQQPTPSPKLPPRRTTQGRHDAVRGGAKEGAAKERPKRAAHPRNFLKY
ncbi:unnamed protein product [Closterium sp. NIES-53]